MADNGHTDTDKGLDKVFQEMEKLKSMCVKVGVTEDVGTQSVGGATLAEIATYNELGVLAARRGVKPTEPYGEGKWFIPPRPFVRGFADGKREQIVNTMQRLGKQVADGKMLAEIAMRRLGQFAQSGIQSYIRNGPHTPNAPSTLARKDSRKPLVDTQLLKNSIRYQIVNSPADQVGGDS